MKLIDFQYPLLLFLSIYFFIAFIPLQYHLGESADTVIPLGQLILLTLVTIFSPIAKNFSFDKSHYIDFKIALFLLFFVVLNSSFQSIFIESNFKLDRFYSIIGTLAPILVFIIILSIDLTEEYIEKVFRYFFYGCFIYSLYYLSYFLIHLSENIKIGANTVRILGQRDSIYLNFTILFALCRFSLFTNITSNNFEKIIAVLSILFCLTITLLSHTRMGYVLLIIDLVLLMFLNPRQVFALIFFIILCSIAFYLFDPVIFGEKLNYSFKRLTEMAQFFTHGSLAGGTGIRLSIWEVIWNNITSSPFLLFFGHGELGVHSLDATYLNFNKNWGYAFFPVDTPESQYFDTLFRRGLVGVICLFIILFRIIYISFKLLIIDSKFSYIYKALIIGFIGVAVTFIFLPLLRDRNFALFFFTVYALLSSRLYQKLSN
jgi:hypothetical protein